MFSNHTEIKPVINKRKRAVTSRYMEVKQHISNKRWLKEDVSKAIKIYTELNENKNTTCQNM